MKSCLGIDHMLSEAGEYPMKILITYSMSFA